MNDFDREFRRANRTINFMVIFNMLLSLAILGFVGWIAIRVLKHFAVI